MAGFDINQVMLSNPYFLAPGRPVLDGPPGPYGIVQSPLAALAWQRVTGQQGGGEPTSAKGDAGSSGGQGGSVTPQPIQAVPQDPGTPDGGADRKSAPSPSMTPQPIDATPQPQPWTPAQPSQPDWSGGEPTMGRPPQAPTLSGFLGAGEVGYKGPREGGSWGLSQYRGLLG